MVQATNPIHLRESIQRLKDDPILFFQWQWPDVRIYDKQAEVALSVRDNMETYVVAGNGLGKDFIAALICIWFFITRDPVRIITTSVAERHLIVLWAEIEKFIHTARFPMLSAQGGPLLLNHFSMRKLFTSGVNKGKKVPISYMIGQVSERGEKMGGHHAEHTLFVGDEASGLDDLAYSNAQGWIKKALVFGNPWDCANFFRRAVDGGDIIATNSAGFNPTIEIPTAETTV